MQAIVFVHCDSRLSAWTELLETLTQAPKCGLKLLPSSWTNWIAKSHWNYRLPPFQTNKNKLQSNLTYIKGNTRETADYFIVQVYRLIRFERNQQNSEEFGVEKVKTHIRDELATNRSVALFMIYEKEIQLPSSLQAFTSVSAFIKLSTHI